MENLKNETSIIVTLERPLLTLNNEGIAALMMQARKIAERAKGIDDQESFTAKLLWTTAFNMMEQAELEISKRN
jgi:hypothetical protein